MSITGMNHAVLYVRDAQRHKEFYEDVLGFVTVIDGPGPFVFMRAPASQNHHDIAFFTIGRRGRGLRSRPTHRWHVSPRMGGGHTRRTRRHAH